MSATTFKAASRRRIVIGPGKSLFQLTPNAVELLNPRDAAQADAVVLPCSLGLAFDRWLAETPPEAWKIGRIVFDASGEGTSYNRKAFEGLHGFLAKVGLSPSQAVYVTQNQCFAEDYAADPPDAGPRMQVLTYDYFIRRFFDFDAAEGEAIFERRLARFRARPARRGRRFISLNYTLRKYKLRFLLEALNDGFLEEGAISVGNFDQHRGRIDALVAKGAFGPLAHRLPDLERYSGMLIGEVPRDAAGQATGSTTSNTEMVEHDDSWFTVVTETEMNRRPIRITEKAFKPLVGFHPLLILGNPGSIARLRDLGFETFAAVYDEGYDKVASPGLRFQQVYDQFAALCRADEAHLARQEAQLAEVLVHNARWGLTGLNAELKRRDEVFVAQMFATT